MEIDGIKAVAESSDKLLTWSLAVIGGTIGTILGTNYKHPNGIGKWMYLLFLPGWICLGVSFYNGTQVEDILNASMAYTNSIDSTGERLMAIVDVYEHQRLFFYYSLLFFGIWLAFYVVWWIISSDTKTKTNDTL
ncbi:hypothetical protein SAMN05421788_10358 [Filimonas lacunae]|uniref:Uncharacterized protein n=1 Tax=Filimonas lacunae TaxID=477680 RepID=A0A1N7P071_9BACT|nr:hypothetical protein [Filimonas lacunae]SIT03839.1 hypothetical protein SAMN05421788_10358 [Filimonas lacunae]